MRDLDFVHKWIPGTEGSSRVLLLLHGTGGDENSLLALGREFDPEAAQLSLRGKVDENGALRFFRRIAEGVFDEEDLVRRAHELADFLGAAAGNYDFALSDVTAVGYSNGANIASAVLLLRPEVLRSAVLLRGQVSLTEPPKPDLSGHRVLISAGATDALVPAENSRQLAALLEARGAQVRLEIQPTGHMLARSDLVLVKEWLARQP